MPVRRLARSWFDSGAAHSASPLNYANEHEVREFEHKIQVQTASGKLLEHHGEKLGPYMTQDTIMRITYQVVDAEGLVVAVPSINDGGMTAVFSLQGVWVCDETPLKPSIRIESIVRSVWISREPTLGECSA